jgi:hypothetical protein
MKKRKKKGISQPEHSNKKQNKIKSNGAHTLTSVPPPSSSLKEVRYRQSLSERHRHLALSFRPTLLVTTSRRGSSQVKSKSLGWFQLELNKRKKVIHHQHLETKPRTRFQGEFHQT